MRRDRDRAHRRRHVVEQLVDARGQRAEEAGLALFTDAVREVALERAGDDGPDLGLDRDLRGAILPLHDRAHGAAVGVGDGACHHAQRGLPVAPLDGSAGGQLTAHVHEVIEPAADQPVRIKARVCGTKLRRLAAKQRRRGVVQVDHGAVLVAQQRRRRDPVERRAHAGIFGGDPPVGFDPFFQRRLHVRERRDHLARLVAGLGAQADAEIAALHPGERTACRVQLADQRATHLIADREREERHRENARERQPDAPVGGADVLAEQRAGQLVDRIVEPELRLLRLEVGGRQFLGERRALHAGQHLGADEVTKGGGRVVVGLDRRGERRHAGTVGGRRVFQVRHELQVALFVGREQRDEFVALLRVHVRGHGERRGTQADVAHVIGGLEQRAVEHTKKKGGADVVVDRKARVLTDERREVDDLAHEFVMGPARLSRREARVVLDLGPGPGDRRHSSIGTKRPARRLVLRRELGKTRVRGRAVVGELFRGRGIAHRQHHGGRAVTGETRHHLADGPLEGHAFHIPAARVDLPEPLGEEHRQGHEQRQREQGGGQQQLGPETQAG